MIIKGTGSYHNVKGGNRVSITGDGGHAWKYYGPAYLKLAPRLVTYTPYAEQLEALNEMKKDLLNYKKHRKKIQRRIEDEYIKSYFETRLKDLDVNLLLETLQERFGEDIILLCHEPIKEFCHRRLVADYIELQTGIYIPELKVTKEGKVKELQPIRYLDRLQKYL